MPNSYFQFKQFTVHQDRCAMKVTTDGCLFGGFVAERINNEELVINNCLDIGTGTGLLSLMFSQKNDCLIDAIEIDAAAAQQATENIAASPFANKIKSIHADARQFLFKKKYDLIISNPPFYERELKGDDEKRNIAHHSEELLLTDLLTIIKHNLSTNGIFYLLLPYKRDTEIKTVFTSGHLKIEGITYIKQTVKHEYFRMMVSGKCSTGNSIETRIDEIAIKDARGNYTPEFIALLKDYYLHL
ncbi:MAG: methyltransferase [Chitinophagaceae bacterium]